MTLHPSTHYSLKADEKASATPPNPPYTLDGKAGQRAVVLEERQ